VTLAETQALFHEILTNPEPMGQERIEGCFAGTPALPAVERVAIYANMYLSRLVDGLRQTFPNLARHLGEEVFASLAEDYLRRNPSEHHDLGQVGRHLAAFLRDYPDPARPDLGDLAELEWARQEIFFAPSVEAVGTGAFAGLDPDSFPRKSLVVSPALRVLVLEHAVTPLWRRLEDGEPPQPPSPGPSAVAVWRSGFDVLHCPISLDEAVALEGAMSGDSLATICAAFTDREEPAATAHQTLSSWLAEGWVVGVADRLRTRADHLAGGPSAPAPATAPRRNRRSASSV
jgi:hypothetical protein